MSISCLKSKFANSFYKHNNQQWQDQDQGVQDQGQDQTKPTTPSSYDQTVRGFWLSKFLLGSNLKFEKNIVWVYGDIIPYSIS